MRKLFRMELYKLNTSKLFYVMLAVVFAVNAVFAAVIPLISKLLVPDKEVPLTDLSNILGNPFILGLLSILIYISAVSFLYSDFSNGYIKNIAGHLKNRSSLVFAKFAVICIHNLLFFIVGAVSYALGAFLVGNLRIDADIAGGLLTMLLKWLLMMALSSILLFFTVAIRSKTLAIVLGVLFATEALNLVYMGINLAVTNVFKIENFNLANYMPDSLFGSVDAVTGELVLNAAIVAVVYIVLFLFLTCKTFRSRDIK